MNKSTSETLAFDFDPPRVRKPHWNEKPRDTPEPPPVIGCRWIPLTKGMFAIVDNADYKLVSGMLWNPHPTKRTVYACSGSGLKGRMIYLHRLLMGDPEGMEVDHRNGEGLDCRRDNLRVCTTKQNRQNMRKTIMPKTSQYKGVCWDKTRNKWRATIKLNREWQYLGRFDDEVMAAQAFDAKARELFGEFARLNFP